ncbi:MAG: FHA domain-containing protein [Pseudomonadales bacterium]
MQVILKPLSHPQLGDICIEEPLFPIGRNEEPFASYTPAAIGTLSRRHARIFVEAGAVYLADVGSRNGTRLNGAQVELKPVRLRRRDKITFGGKLEYEIDIVGQPELTNPSMAAPVRLTLMPLDEHSQLEPISITHFPFLISKSDPAFVRSAAISGKQINFLSRRHAHIFLKGDKPFIEDLGSTNGTYINTERLDEHAKPILSGDSISFGENYLVYTATLQANEIVAKEPELEPTGSQPVAEPAAEADAGEHTIFVSSANSFLDIFCVQEEDEEEVVAEEAVEEQPEAAVAAKATVERPNLLQKIRVFAHELRAAFSESESGDRRWIWGVLGGIAVTFVVVTVLYLANATEREIRSLLAKQDYFNSAELANEYLADHPDAKEVRALATEALMKHTVVPWVAGLEQGQFAKADATLKQAATLTTANANGKTLLDLLTWITHLHRFMAERGGSNAPIRIFEHEQPMAALLRWWDAEAEANRRHMYQVLDYAPEFKDINALSFSYQRTLRSEKSVYLAAIENLKATIQTKLDSDRAAELEASLSAFEKQYPRISGIGKVQVDLKNYLALQDTLGSNDLRGAKTAIARTNFSTPPFKEKVAQLEANVLPSKEVATQYERASETWRAGKLEQAIAALEQLANKTGGEMAVRQIKHKRQLINDYRVLQQERGKTDYAQRLLEFYGQLDPQEDSYFIAAIDQDFKRYSGQASQQADTAWNVATQRWQAYQNGGGILGLQRLEDYVSPMFKRQAKLLSEAYDNAKRGNDIHALLKQGSSPERREMYQKILAEAELQRRSLGQLSMVLSPALLNAKLDLLAGRGGAKAK